MLDMLVFLGIMSVVVGFAMGVVGSLGYLNRIGYVSPWKPLVVLKEGLLFASLGALFVLAVAAALPFIDLLVGGVISIIGKLLFADNEEFFTEKPKEISNPGFWGILFHVGFLGFAVPMCLIAGAFVLFASPWSKASFSVEEMLLIVLLFCPGLTLFTGLCSWIDALRDKEHIRNWPASSPFVFTYFLVWLAGLGMYHATPPLFPRLRGALIDLTMLVVFVLLFRFDRRRERQRRGALE